MLPVNIFLNLNWLYGIIEVMVMRINLLGLCILYSLNNGFTLQWARVSITNAVSFIYYPITFVSACRQISFTHWYNDGDWKAQRAFMVTSIQKNKCYVKAMNIYDNALTSAPVSAFILCIGY